MMPVTMPVLLAFLRPSDTDAIVLDLQKNPDAPYRQRPVENLTPAQWLEYSWIDSAFIGIAGEALTIMVYVRHNAAFPGVNAVVFVMSIASSLLQVYPLVYAETLENAAAQTGSMMQRYPLYGSIMGIVGALGLPDVLSLFFIAITNNISINYARKQIFFCLTIGDRQNSTDTENPRPQLLRNERWP